MEHIVKQKVGKVCNGGNRLYIEDKDLERIGFKSGDKYSIGVTKNKITIKKDNNGKNIICKRVRKEKEIPIIDKVSDDIKKELVDMDFIKISFLIDSNGEGLVNIQGEKNTKNEINNKPESFEKIKKGFLSNDINEKTKTGRTMLMTACAYGDFESVKYLIKNGANKEIRDIYNKDCFDYLNKKDPLQEGNINYHKQKILIKNFLETGLELKCMTFCSGGGITSHFNKKVGFKEVGACEFNPKSGAEDKYSNIYSANHPETIMFNIPMEKLKGSDLPYADLWVATLDCSDYSPLANNKSEYHTMHLFMHLMRLFWERDKKDRPSGIFIENVPNFQKIAGNSLKLCLEEEGYSVNMTVVNSINFGSRTKRERFFLFAHIKSGYEFPAINNPATTPISSDGVITTDSIEWQSLEENKTMAYYFGRNADISHNYKTKTYNIDKDCHIGTITKSSNKGKAENILKHPSLDKYAWVTDVSQIKYLHSVPESYFCGDSKTTAIEVLGQAVCGKTYEAIIQSVYTFMSAG